MNIGLLGYGQMGRAVERIAEGRGHGICCRCTTQHNSPPSGDVCIDFSHSDAVLSHIQMALNKGIPLVVGTTGWFDAIDQVAHWVEECEGALVYSPNFSIGMNLFQRMAEHASRLFSPISEYDAAIVESHHSQKVDSPSGSALALQRAIRLQGENKTAVPITSVRSGYNPGTHQVIFDSLVDTVTLTHQARSRDGFALGAILAAEWVVKRKGLYSFQEVVDSYFQEVFHGVSC